MQDFNKQLKELDKLAKKTAKELANSDPDWIDIPGIIDHRYRVVFEQGEYVGVQSVDAFSGGYADLFLFTKEQWDEVKDDRLAWSDNCATRHLGGVLADHDLKKSRRWFAREVRKRETTKDRSKLRTLAIPVFLLLINMVCCVIWLTIGGNEGSILKSFTGVVYLLTSCTLSVSLYVRYENS